jgi:hypothetical protein
LAHLGHNRDAAVTAASVSASVLPTFLAYLDRRRATCAGGTVSNTVSRLAHFGRHLATVDPGLAALADLDRRCHIETYLTVVTTATRPRDGTPIAVSERRARIITCPGSWPTSPSGL